MYTVMTFVFMSKLITTAHVTTPIHCHYHFKCYGFKIVGAFLVYYALGWAAFYGNGPEYAG